MYNDNMTPETYITEEKLTHSILDAIQEQKAWTVKLVETAVKSIIDLEDRQDQLYEQFEKQLAALTSAYIEMAAMLESLISSFVNRSEEDREEFFGNLRNSRKNMIDILKHASNDVNQDADKFVAYNPSTIEQSEDSQLSDE